MGKEEAEILMPSPAGADEPEEEPYVRMDSGDAGGSEQHDSGGATPRGAGGRGRAGRLGYTSERPLVVAGKEAVGRQLAVWSQRLMAWPKASVAQYNPDTGQHLIRYLDRPAGAIKHEEAWVHLGAGEIRFQWLAPPPPGAPPNPTAVGAPQREEAVGWKVRVFWPGMSKWYFGRVRQPAQ